MLSSVLASTVADGVSWGVPDSTFLVTYAVVGVVAVLAAQVWRLLVVGTPEDHAEPRPLSAVEIAMIEGGPTQAVTATLTELRSRGLLDSDYRATRRATDADELSETVRGVHDYIRDHDGLESESELLHDHGVARRIRRMRLDLISRGLLMTDQRRRLIMWSVSPVALLEIVGGLRVASDLADGRGVTGLLIVMVLLLAIGCGIVLTVPNRTPEGEAVARALHD